MNLHPVWARVLEKGKPFLDFLANLKVNFNWVSEILMTNASRSSPETEKIMTIDPGTQNTFYGFSNQNLSFRVPMRTPGENYPFHYIMVEYIFPENVISSWCSISFGSLFKRKTCVVSCLMENSHAHFKLGRAVNVGLMNQFNKFCVQFIVHNRLLCLRTP